MPKIPEQQGNVLLLVAWLRRRSITQGRTHNNAKIASAERIVAETGSQTAAY
jgi:hypothetical protein